MTRHAKRAIVVQRMGLAQRDMFGAAGIAFSIAAVAALFVSENHLGTVAAAVIGAIFLAIAIVGLVPTRLSLKDLEVVLAELAETALDVAGPTGAEEILAQAKEVLPTPVLQEADRRVGIAIQYERDVLEALRRVTGPNTQLITEARQGRPGIGWAADAVIRRGQKRLFIDVKMVHPRTTATRIEDVIARALGLGGRWLLITDGPVLARSAERLATMGVAHAVWTSPGDDGALHNAISEALASEPGSGGRPA